MWSPVKYQVFATERARPFHDLMAQVPPTDPGEVVDLGCGPGTLTLELASRWPNARVVGVDSAPEMIEATPSRGAEFVLADLRNWSPERPVDVLVSNAALQWVPGHLDLLPRLAGYVAPGGWFAFQVPANFSEPSHVLLREQAASPRWRSRLDVTWPSSHEPITYLDELLGLGFEATVWEATYLQVLAGDDVVLEWMTGTALRPVLAELTGSDADEFLSEYRSALRAAYPRGPYGTVLPYRRVFAVAHREQA